MELEVFLLRCIRLPERGETKDNVLEGSRTGASLRARLLRNLSLHRKQHKEHGGGKSTSSRVRLEDVRCEGEEEGGVRYKQDGRPAYGGRHEGHNWTS